MVRALVVGLALVLLELPSAEAQDCRRNCKRGEVRDRTTGCCKKRRGPRVYKPRYTRPTPKVSPIALGRPKKLQKLGQKLTVPSLRNPCERRAIAASEPEVIGLKRRVEGARRDSAKHTELLHKLADAYAGHNDFAEAHKLYQRLGQKRNYARADEVLFSHAALLLRGNQGARARVLYRNLIRDYPKSKHIPCAIFNVADYFRSRNESANAKRAYDKVLNYPKSPAYQYALYYSGVAALARSPKIALSRLVKAAVEARAAKLDGIARAAEANLVEAYVKVGDPKSAEGFFRRFPESEKLLRALYDRMIESGKESRAIFVLSNKLTRSCEVVLRALHYGVSIGSPAVRDLVAMMFQGIRCPRRAVPVIEAAARSTHSRANQSKDLADIDRALFLYDKHIKASSGARRSSSAILAAELEWTRAEIQSDAKPALRYWNEAATAFTEASKLGGLSNKRRDEMREAARRAKVNAGIARRFAR